MSTLPSEMGVFALPNTVLFPDALMPLHIFEPRYQTLIQDALRADGHLVMAVPKPGFEETYYDRPALYTTGCVGRIVEHQPGEDGCSDIILRGETAVRLDGFVDDRPYQVARISAVEDGEARADETVPPNGELHQLLEAACPGCLGVLRQGWPGDFDRDCTVELLHTVAMHLPVSVETRLRWLACSGPKERWERIRETLTQLAANRVQQREVLTLYRDLQPGEPGVN